VATNTTRLGIRRVTGSDLFKPYTVDLPSIVDTIDTKAVQFRAALAASQVRDVGEVGQLRAGRVLTPADFTRMGLAAPLGLWNLGDVTDASGAGRTLTNKGAVPFGPGIMGAATEAAVFAGRHGRGGPVPHSHRLPRVLVPHGEAGHATDDALEVGDDEPERMDARSQYQQRGSVRRI
jgi:hypothetical protein